MESRDLPSNQPDETLIVTAHDVLLASTLTHFVLTHPGNLAFSVLCQWHASKLPPNGETVNAHPTACRISQEVFRRGGRFLVLKNQSSTPKTLLSDERIIDRIVSILVTIRSVRRLQDAVQLSTPEILFTYNKPLPFVRNPTQPNRFPLSFWYKMEYDAEQERELLVVAPPELPQPYGANNQKRHPSASAPTTPKPARNNTDSSADAQKGKVVLTKDLIEDNIPADASCVFHIFDRRVNFDNHASDASLYSLMRSWVQDDPHRIVSAVGQEMGSYDSVIVSAPEENDFALYRPAASKKRRIDMFELLSEAAQATQPAETVQKNLGDLLDHAKQLRRRHTARIKRDQAEAVKRLQKRGVVL